MHVNAETFHTIFLSPAEMGQIRVELTQFFDDHDINIQLYPALDRLTDALIHGGTPDTDAKTYSNEM